MAYKLKQIEALGLSVATTLGYGFKAGYWEDTNTSFTSANVKNILMLVPERDIEDRNKRNRWLIEIVGIYQHKSDSTLTEFEKFDAVKDILKAFLNAFVNQTNVSEMSTTRTYENFTYANTENLQHCCSCKIEIEVIDC